MPGRSGSGKRCRWANNSGMSAASATSAANNQSTMTFSPALSRSYTTSSTSTSVFLISVVALVSTADAFVVPIPSRASVASGMPSPTQPLSALYAAQSPRRKSSRLPQKMPQFATNAMDTLETPNAFETGNTNAKQMEGFTNVKRLSHQEEISLLTKMKSHPPESIEYQTARQSLIIHNLPLVKSIVTKTMRKRNPAYTNNSHVGAALTPQDLLHEGTIGLAEALDKYDVTHSSDARLGTYATYWIRARVVRAIQNREYTFRFPERSLLASYRLVKAVREMGVDWEFVLELANDTNVVKLVAEERKVGTGNESKEHRMQMEQLKKDLKRAANIPSDSLLREAIRVRAACQSGTPAEFKPWMAYSASSAFSTTSSSSTPPENNISLFSWASSSEEDLLQVEIEMLNESRPQHIRETLSKFLMPREVEVLALRYGISSKLLEASEKQVAPGEQKERDGADFGERKVSVEVPVFRDYQAEAEEELFGPNGMLSHYSNDSAPTSMNKSVDRTPIRSNPLARAHLAGQAVAKRNLKNISNISRNFTSHSMHQSISPNNALLSYKEVGKRMTLSAEYCRRICTVALQKLSRAVEEGKLAESDFLLGW